MIVFYDSIKFSENDNSEMEFDYKPDVDVYNKYKEKYDKLRKTQNEFSVLLSILNMLFIAMDTSNIKYIAIGSLLIVILVFVTLSIKMKIINNRMQDNKVKYCEVIVKEIIGHEFIRNKKFYVIIGEDIMTEYKSVCYIPESKYKDLKENSIIEVREYTVDEFKV